MKKLTFIIVIFFCFNMYGQWGAAAIKLGAFNPGASDAGFIIGYEGGKYIDENFNFGWGIDWFPEIYGVTGNLNEIRASTNLHDIPLMINVTAKFPIAPRAKFYATGGIGAEVLIIDYRSFENPDNSELKGAFDFNWRVGLGAAYNIGPRSELLLEMAYHSSKPSWTYDVDYEEYGKQ